MFTLAFVYLLASSRTEKEKRMFVTFTDWSMNNPEDGVETANTMWPQMQQVGTTESNFIWRLKSCVAAPMYRGVGTKVQWLGAIMKLQFRASFSRFVSSSLI